MLNGIMSIIKHRGKSMSKKKQDTETLEDQHDPYEGQEEETIIEEAPIQASGKVVKVVFNVNVNQYNKGDVLIFDKDSEFITGMLAQKMAEVVE